MLHTEAVFSDTFILSYVAETSIHTGDNRFTRTLPLELAPEGSTANCVAPGFVSTQMVETLPEDIKGRLREDTPLARLGDVEEIAAVVTFLASDGSSFITREVIDVNGDKDL